MVICPGCGSRYANSLFRNFVNCNKCSISVAVLRSERESIEVETFDLVHEIAGIQFGRIRNHDWMGSGYDEILEAA